MPIDWRCDGRVNCENQIASHRLESGSGRWEAFLKVCRVPEEVVELPGVLAGVGGLSTGVLTAVGGLLAGAEGSEGGS